MARQVSLADLKRYGVTIQPEEAVAVVQQLIHSGPAGHATRQPARPPFGPPSPGNVYVSPDGTVSCAGCEATLAVSEAAIFLQSILPGGSSHIGGSLRYVVARALHDVDVTPFDSVEDFSRTLARYEQGDSAEVVRRLLSRASAASSSMPAAFLPAAINRRTVSDTAELRRQPRVARARSSRSFAVAAGVAVGVALIGAGEMLHGLRQSSLPPPQSARVRSASGSNIELIKAPPAAAVDTPELEHRTTGVKPSKRVRRETTASASRETAVPSGQTALTTHQTTVASSAHRPEKRSPFGWLRKIGITVNKT